MAPAYPRVFQKLAQRDESESTYRDLTKYNPDVKQALETPPRETLDTIVDALNTILMRDDFYRAADFGEMAVEAEAKRLAKRPAAGLSPLELERLNRLLLEAAFPNCIKKLYVAGWRPVMFIYRSLGLLVAGLFWFCFRDSPSLHPRCNAAEVTLIGYQHSSSKADRQKRPRTVPLKHIVKSRSLWLMCITQWGSNVGWVFLVTWLPRYLLEVHSIPLEQRGWMAAAPLFVGWSGMLLGGWLTDRVTHQLGLRWGRALPIASGRFLAMSAYLTCLLHPSPWLMTAAFAVVAFSTDVGSASIWSYKQDVGGRDVGSVHGWANMWGNLGATISPILLQSIVVHFGWDAAFLVCATSFFIAGVAALGIDASIPVVPPDEYRDEA